MLGNTDYFFKFFFIAFVFTILIELCNGIDCPFSHTTHIYRIVLYFQYSQNARPARSRLAGIHQHRSHSAAAGRPTCASVSFSGGRFCRLLLVGDESAPPSRQSRTPGDKSRGALLRKTVFVVFLLFSWLFCSAHHLQRFLYLSATGHVPYCHLKRGKKREISVAIQQSGRKLQPEQRDLTCCVDR